MKVYVLTASTYIPYQGDFIEVKGVALDEVTAIAWVADQNQNSKRYHVTYDYDEFDTIGSFPLNVIGSMQAVG